MGKVLTSDKSLTDKQAKFCQEYLIDFNGTRAAIAAGYSTKTARFTASQNLTKRNIIAMLCSQNKELKKVIQIDKEESLKRQNSIANLNITEAVQIVNGEVVVKDTADLPEEVTKMITSIRNTKDGPDIKFMNKQEALNIISKHNGVGNDKLDVNVSGELNNTVRVFVIPSFKGTKEEKTDIKKIVEQKLMEESEEKKKRRLV